MRLCPLDPYERWVLEHADYFTAVVFKGRGRSIEEAERAAQRVGTVGRPVMVYAVDLTHQALVATCGAPASARAG